MSPTLKELASPRSAERGPAPAGGGSPTTACELCSEALPEEHRHLLDLESRGLICVCRACMLLFERDAAGGEHYRLIGDRRLRLEDFELDDVLWDELRIPVEMAFFFRHSGTGRMMAYYPSPMGPTESLLELDAWSALEHANPVLREMEDDVEALLVNRASEGGDRFLLVPLDDCYDLVGLIRTCWKGLGGGGEVWRRVAAFFDRLEKDSKAWPREAAAKET